MHRTRISLLGPPRVERDGESVEADTRKAVALLAYLAVTQNAVRRDTLADLLWPEYAQKKARAALRRTLSALSEARSEGWLVVKREDVSLEWDEVWTDATRFRELLEERKFHGHPDAEVCPECERPLSEAVALYRGDFMEGFGLRDSAVFDDWQFFQGEELRRELSSALERLSRAEAARGDFESAVSRARRRLDLDRLSEGSHRLLMELYALSGQRTAALRQYEECSRTLEKELGISPLEETTELHEAIKANDLPPPPKLSEYRPDSPPSEAASSESHAPLERETGPMVGREAEWAKLLGAYEGSASGGRFVGIEGEAGIGKTRLAEELSRHAAASGAATVAVRCYPDEGSLAYGPFAGALSTVGEARGEKLENVPEHHLGEAARLAPGIGGVTIPLSPPSGSPGAQSRFFEGISQTLASALDGSRPGVFFVDDAQWADGASLDLLSYFVRRIGEKRICVLATWRSDLVPDGHPLRRLLASARRSRAGCSIALTRLDREATASLVEAALGEVPGLGERLYGETEGLPLLVTEYLMAMESGEIGAKDESWPLPSGARDLLRERLSAVGEAGRRVLGAAAAIGRSFDLDTLREASGHEEEEVILALEGLEGRGLVEEIAGEGPYAAYDFAHEKIRALVYEETSLARRRLLHRRVAESLTRRPHPKSAASRVARHFEMAGMNAEAAEHFVFAGEAHRSLYANVEALSQFRSALALGHPDEAGIHESIGDLLTLAGEYEAATRSFESAKEGSGGEDLARVERKLGNLRRRLGEWSLAEAHFETALDVLEGEIPGESSGEKARLHSEMALLFRSRGSLDAAAESSKKALELAGAAGDALALARTHNVAAMVSRSDGNLPEARSHLEKSLEILGKLEDPEIRIAALNNLALIHSEAGEKGKALDITREALEMCVALGDRHHEAALRNNLADLLHETGREEESRKSLEEAVGIFAEIGGEGEWQPEIWKLSEW